MFDVLLFYFSLLKYMEKNVSPANLVDRELEYDAKNIFINLDYGPIKL